MRILWLSVHSTVNFIRLVFARKLHLKSNHLWTKYKVADKKTYAVFRETVSSRDYSEKEVTLIIGFRLKIIDGNRFFHWLFQRLCILDTPVWVGFSGFKTKFWMVEPKTKDYLGLYRYQGKKNAQNYANYITAILKPLSTKNSVWYEIIEENFDNYLKRSQS